MKKGLALVLAAAMAAGTMTGCSGGGSTGKAAVGNTETADTAAEAAEGGETAQTEPVSYEVTEPITIEQICHKFFMSRTSLQALFKMYLHNSPKSYLLGIKLQKSKELIRENQYTISEIADMLGFSSIHYFSRLFKKYFELSPSEYAKEIAASENN